VENISTIDAIRGNGEIAIKHKLTCRTIVPKTETRKDNPITRMPKTQAENKREACLENVKL